MLVVCTLDETPAGGDFAPLAAWAAAAAAAAAAALPAGGPAPALAAAVYEDARADAAQALAATGAAAAVVAVPRPPADETSAASGAKPQAILSDDGLRRRYAPRALMRTRLLLRALEVGGDSATVWFLGRDEPPRAETLPAALSFVRARWQAHGESVCVTVPWRPPGAASPSSFRPAQLQPHSDHFHIGRGGGVLVETSGAGAGAGAGAAADGRGRAVAAVDVATFRELHAATPLPGGLRAGRARAGTLDWAVASLMTFAKAPFRVVQIPAKSVWMALTPGQKELKVAGHATGKPFVGESVGWFWAASEAGISVYVLVPPAEQ